MAAKLAQIEQLPLELCLLVQEHLKLQDIARLLQCSQRTRSIWEPELYKVKLVQEGSLIRACQDGNVALYKLLLRYGSPPLLLRSRGSKVRDCLRPEVFHQTPYLEVVQSNDGMRTPALSTLELAIRYQQHTFFKTLLETVTLGMLEYGGALGNVAMDLTVTSNERFLRTLLASEPHATLVWFFKLSAFPIATLILCGASTALIDDLINFAESPETVIASQVKSRELPLNLAEHGARSRLMLTTTPTKKLHLDYSPVQAAMVAGSLEILELLLRCGATLPNMASQDRHCPGHTPQSSFYFCATSEQYEKMAAMFDACLNHGADINEYSCWPIVLDSKTHEIIMTPICEYIFSLPSDVWTSNKAWQVLEIINLFVESGATLEPATDEALIRNYAIEPSVCTKNWLIKFALARWRAATLNSPAFFAFIEFLFQNEAAQQFIPQFLNSPYDATEETKSLTRSGNMKLMQLTVHHRVPHLSRHELQMLLLQVKHLENAVSTQDNDKDTLLFQHWYDTIEYFHTNCSNPDTQLCGFCNTCSWLASMDMEDAQPIQERMWSDHLMGRRWG